MCFFASYELRMKKNMLQLLFPPPRLLKQVQENFVSKFDNNDFIGFYIVFLLTRCTTPVRLRFLYLVGTGQSLAFASCHHLHKHNAPMPLQLPSHFLLFSSGALLLYTVLLYSPHPPFKALITERERRAGGATLLVRRSFKALCEFLPPYMQGQELSV